MGAGLGQTGIRKDRSDSLRSRIGGLCEGPVFCASAYGLSPRCEKPARRDQSKGDNWCSCRDDFQEVHMNTMHRFYMVDVFAERSYSGNPLAVVVGEDALSDASMQQLAAEMNFSETTFVTPVPDDNGGYRVRIFTPVREIAFAGHPILGTAWVLRHHVASEPGTQVALNLAVGTGSGHI